jgi:calcineurin-like phosphoesterase
VRILFIGDIVGRPGRELLRQGLAALVDHHSIDFVIANAENSAAGFGITRDIGEQLLDLAASW